MPNHRTTRRANAARPRAPRQPSAATTPRTHLTRLRRGESRYELVARRTRTAIQERKADSAAPATSPAPKEKETNFKFEEIRSTWFAEPHNLLPAKYHPRMDKKPLPNGRIAVRQGNSRKWPSNALGVLAMVAKETGVGRGEGQLPMICIASAIAKRQKETGVEARVDVGITEGDVFTGLGVWKAKMMESEAEDKQREEALLAENQRMEAELEEAKREEAKLKDAKPGAGGNH